MLYLRARWYAPEIGTFLSRDPVESEPAYVYVRNNPTNLTDPRGTFPPTLLRDSYGNRMVEFWQRQDKWWWERLLEAEHGDMLISWDKKRVAQFVLEDPLMRGYQEVWHLPPWGECPDPPAKHPIKLEWFTSDGQFYSETSPIFAEIWRQNTGSFYYTGLHPNDPTWAQFIFQHPSFRTYMSDYQGPIFGVYYGTLQGRVSHIAQHVATGLDTWATWKSFQNAVAVDTTGAMIISFGCGGGWEGCVAGAQGAYQVDRFMSKIASIRDVRLGILSLIATGTSDVLGGYTTIDGRIRIGEATVHTSITFGEGWISEANILLYSNIKQVLYDLGIDHYVDVGVYDVKAVEIGW